MLRDAPAVGVDVRADETDLHRRASSSGPCSAGSRDRDRCHRAGSALTRVRGSRTSRSWRPKVRTWPDVPWNDPWKTVSWATTAARTSAAVRPGNSVHPTPIAPSACASLLPTIARPFSSAKLTTRECRPARRHRRVERLQRIGVESLVGSVQQPADDPALRAQRVQDQWMGGDRQPPASWISATVALRVGADGSAGPRTARGRGLRLEISSPTITSARIPRSAAIAEPPAPRRCGRGR